MKIEIDLNDILGDEFGAETIQESVRRQVIDSLKHEIRQGIKGKIDTEIQEVIKSEVIDQVKRIAPDLLEGLLDLEYQPVTSWGSRESGPTTMRREFVKQMQKEFVYKKANYDSDKNAFTRSIDDTLKLLLEQFKKEFNVKVDEQFLVDAHEYAFKKIKERFKV